MDTLQNRLEKFLKVYGITMQYFEQQCNIAQGLGKKLSEKSYGTTFKRISEGFPQLNIEWLRKVRDTRTRTPRSATRSQSGQKSSQRTGPSNYMTPLPSPSAKSRV